MLLWGGTTKGGQDEVLVKVENKREKQRIKQQNKTEIKINNYYCNNTKLNCITVIVIVL